MPKTPKNPTTATVETNRAAAERYPMSDQQDFEDAHRGFIAAIPDGKTLADNGNVIFDASKYDYLKPNEAAPESVNPSLWRQSRVNVDIGLFKVVDRLYQIRGSSMANLTIVEGDDGLIVIDTMTGVETARQGMDLFRKHVTDKPVVAVVYTHTHVDHYAGIKGVVDPADVASGKISIIAPGTVESFDKHALGENIIAGTAMSRRASYCFGGMLPQGPKGMLSVGVGLPVNVGDTITYLSPTDPITRTGETRRIAGLTFEFLYAPDTEAPEEMHVWIPELKALTCAENANHSMHNIQTLRGARTRDARNFARYLDETLVRWGEDVEVHYGTHIWPVFGNANVLAFLESQRDVYKYIHDQALRLANKGLTPIEAAEEIQLPPELGRHWYNHGYHGTLNHNIKAVYAKELGWWDGDPAHLFPLPPTESAKRYVALVGAEAMLADARGAFADGDYRWVVELLHHLVFAEPDNTEAKNLQADAYEQLGYQSEGPQWRAIFLTAAMELRNGVDAGKAINTVAEDVVLNMPMDLLFDYVAVHIVGMQAGSADIRVNVTVDDIGEEWTFWVANGVLNARKEANPDARLTVGGRKAAVTEFLLNPSAVGGLVDAGKLRLDGDRGALDELAALLDTFDPNFPIVTP
ncbi:alkyl/aryl-sulfatase [Stackebrandtia soli]|uniref:alkyl/aryl-sulfatase n=1 Tax=Stackebrandtia soli TaxID=1892856 RepID=UPI0039E8A87D